MMVIIMFKWGIYQYCSSLVPSFTSFSPFSLIRHRSCYHCWASDCLFCRSVSEVKKVQLLNSLMKSGHSRWICICAINRVCLRYTLCWQSWMKYWISCDTFVVRSVEFPELFRITLCFFLGGSSNVVMSPILWLSRAVPRIFSFSQFIACIVLIAHNIIELQSVWEWVENESVEKDYPQKTILEIHYCNHQYPLRIGSQNIVFVPGELSRASRNRYAFAAYQFHNTFLGIPESVPRRSVEHTRTFSKIQHL